MKSPLLLALQNNKAEEEKQAAQKKRIVAKFSAKSPVYENCRMLSQVGRPFGFFQREAADRNAECPECRDEGTQSQPRRSHMICHALRLSWTILSRSHAWC